MTRLKDSVASIQYANAPTVDMSGWVALVTGCVTGELCGEVGSGAGLGLLLELLEY